MMKRITLLAAMFLLTAAYPATPPAYYDVVGKGADPSGVNDSAPAILATMTSACAFTTPVPVYIPMGTYKFASSVAFPCDGLRVYGAGSTSRLVAAPSTASPLFFYIPKNNATIDHLSFDGSASTVGGDGSFITSFNATGVTIENNEFTNNRYIISSNQGSSAVQIRRNTFANVSTWQQTLPDWSVATGYTAGQLVHNIAGAALYQQTVATCTSVSLGVGPTGTGTGIVDNTCRWDYVRSSFLVTNTFGGGSNNVFDDNYMSCCIGGDPFDAGNQINFHAANNRIIGNNTGYVNSGSAGSGMYVYGDNPTGSVGVVIANNYIYGLTGNGIDLSCQSKTVVTGNVSLNNGGAGISLAGSNPEACVPQQISVTGNVLMNNNQSLAGRVQQTTDGVTAAGNNVLNFASTAGVVDGMFVYDEQNFATVAKFTRVLSHTGTTVTMTTNAIGAGVASAQLISFYNRYPAAASPGSGIWIGCVDGACNPSDIAIANNIALDDQATKTQLYGVAVRSIDTTVTNLRISQDNVLRTNRLGELSGPGAVLIDSGSIPNTWACGAGTGLISSGSLVSMACGNLAEASGTASRAMGNSVKSSGTYGDTAGGAAYDFGRYGWQGYASGQFGTLGDAQAGHNVLRGTGNTTAVIRLTSNGAAVSGTNCATISANRAHAVTITIIALDKTTITNNAAWFNWVGLLSRGATNGSTTVVMQTKPTPTTNGTVTGIDVAVTADTTNSCLNVSFTPPTSNTDTWNVVADVRSTETQ